MLDMYNFAIFHELDTGRNPPGLLSERLKVAHFDDEKFLKEVSKYGGLPAAMHENSEVKELFVPVLRSDFSLLEEYEYRKYPERIQSSVTIFYSDSDFSTDDFSIESWRDYTENDITIVKFQGSHFFCMEDHARNVIMKTIIRNSLEGNK